MDIMFHAMTRLALAASPRSFDEDASRDSDGKFAGEAIDLRNKDFFPPFLSLPHEREVHPSWHDRVFGSIFTPRKHWCFLAEIVEHVFWPIRPMYTVRDVSGREWLVAFHLDDRSLFPVIERTYKVGHTIAVMYAEGHMFMDGRIGLRIENKRSVRILPCQLDTLLEISNNINKPTGKCPICDKPANHRCSQCKLLYCGRECQVLDWKLTHKKECIIRRQIFEWSTFGWEKFDRFRGFQELEDELSSTLARRPRCF